MRHARLFALALVARLMGDAVATESLKSSAPERASSYDTPGITSGTISGTTEDARAPR